jgi:hypothetical protein
MHPNRIAGEPGFQQVLGQPAGLGRAVLHRYLHSFLISAVSPAVSTIFSSLFPDIFLEKPGKIADVLCGNRS